jgi:hypothetical protein
MSRKLFSPIMIFLFIPFAYASKTHQVELGVPTLLKTGERIQLKGTTYELALANFFEPVKCAVPGFNCGAGYRPPSPHFSVQCKSIPCPYFYETQVKGQNSVEVVIHSEESCAALKSAASSCFYGYSRSVVKKAEDCLNLKTALGRYHCVQRFHLSLPESMRTVCDDLPKDIPGLQASCWYDWAIRFKDSRFCASFTKEDTDGSSRCWAKMAQELKDRTLCMKIPPGDHYRGICERQE